MKKPGLPRNLPDTASYKTLKQVNAEKRRAKKKKAAKAAKLSTADVARAKKLAERYDRRSPDTLPIPAVAEVVDRASTVLEEASRRIAELEERLAQAQRRLVEVESGGVETITTQAARIVRLETWAREAGKTGIVDHAGLAEVLK